MRAAEARPREAVIIPIKSFHAAKARLAAVLSPRDRAALARWAADRVIAACRGLEVHVACEDPEVADWARARGAAVLEGPGLGLNGSVDAAVAALSARGITRVMIVHGDLPLAADLAALGARIPPEGILLVPDRHGEGTNLVLRPVDLDLAARYGPGSFRAHLAAALATGRPVTVRRDLHLGIDLDVEQDLAHPLIAPLLAGLLHTDHTDHTEHSEDTHDGE